MEPQPNLQPAPIDIQPQKSHTALWIFLAVLITAIIVGGIIYAWQRTIATNMQLEAQKQIQELQQQKTANYNQLPDSTSSAVETNAPTPLAITLDTLNGTNSHLKAKLPMGMILKDPWVTISTSSNSRYMVRVDNQLSFPNNYSYRATGPYVSIYLEPKPGVTLTQLQNWLPQAEIEEGGIEIGLGDIVKFLQQAEDNKKLVTGQGYPVQRVVTDWGSGASSDIAAYLIQLPTTDKLFSRVLVQWVNIWPEPELPKVLDNKYLEILQQKHDSRAQIYNGLDTIIQSLVIE